MKYKKGVLFQTSWKFFAYQNTVITISKIARINIKNSFHFFERWTSKDPFFSLFYMGDNSSFYVEGAFIIYTGSRVYINKGATLNLGSGYINNNLNLSCFENITRGNNVAISENVTIRDSDNHTILDGRHVKTQPVTIGNNVWIGANVTILKGVHIGDGSIIAAGSVVTANIPVNVLAAGVRAHVIRTNVRWE
ncbi:acyltransferase [Kaistella polysaccharea]|uniref:acyltransferase n=1 Tax=Kaistella polysaccharea TaxID=2878534 RepID=UPI001CF34BE1|nr:acyltransferase [Kaistella polysaccharea]